MTHVFHRNPCATLPVATHGEGVYLYDNIGKKYLDACGGAAVSCLGHNHPAPTKAIQAQAAEFAYVHSGFFTTAAAEELADRLASLAPGDINHAIFVSGGSEAMETALKLSRQYYVERGELSRKHFISRRQSFHGNTLGALSVGNNEPRKEPYRPLLMNSNAIAPCYPYREQREEESEREYGFRIAAELEQKIVELGPDSVIGFVAETVGGATSGVQPPVDGYLQHIRKICDDYDILLILDEIMCGCGRTGTFLSCTQDEVVPDIVTLAKGLGAGYQPIAATLCSDSIYSAISEGSGALMHGFTYMGHTIACAAALAVLNTIVEDGLLDNVRKQGDYLISQLQQHLGSHPNVGDIRGRGLLVGIEFVADRASKKALNPNYSFHAVLKRVCQQNGLLCYPAGGTIDGLHGDHVLLAPPYIADETNINQIIELLTDSINESLVQIEI